MYDYGLSTLTQYGIEVKSSSRTRGALVCRTEQGILLLREFHGSEKKLLFQQEVLKKLSREGCLVDTFIEKDSAVNDEIEKLRHSATRSLIERDDVIVVASVSCIYGIGSKEEYGGMKAMLSVGEIMDRDDFLKYHKILCQILRCILVNFHK